MYTSGAIVHSYPSSLPNPSSSISQQIAIYEDDLGALACPSSIQISKKRKRSSSAATPRRGVAIPRKKLDGYPRLHDRLPALTPWTPTETTPLLDPLRLDRVEENSEVAKFPEDSRMHMIKEELGNLLRYTGPIFGTHLSEYTLLIVPVVCIGHSSTTELAALTLGSMFATITGFSIIQGFISALDTLLPAIWTSSHPELVGLWTQRMGVVMAGCLIPIFILWFNAESIFILLHQDSHIAHMASVYLRWISIGLPAYTFSYISRRYYKAQGRFSIPSKITSFVAALNAVLSYLLVLGPPAIRLGFIGAPIASAISFNATALLFLLHGRIFGPRKAWKKPSWQMFTNLNVLIHLGFCGIGQIGLRLWAWEFLTFTASLLGPLSLASQSILVISAATIFRAPFALGIATSIRIGNVLGQQDATRARVVASTAIALVIVLSTFTSIFVMVFAKYWAYIFNHDPEVIHLVARIMPLIALFQVFHGTSAVTGAIARARGKQLTGALVNLSAYYIMGFPIGIFLAFKHGYGLSGLWIGMVVSLISCAASGLYLCLRVDWDNEVQQVIKRLQADRAYDGSCASMNPADMH